MTIEHERQLLAPFFARAATGDIATAGEIKQAFEAQVGHEVDESTVYRLLTRHGWRKLVPRPVHPQASKEAQEQFKKTVRRLHVDAHASCHLPWESGSQASP